VTEAALTVCPAFGPLCKARDATVASDSLWTRLPLPMALDHAEICIPHDGGCLTMARTHG
jgi:hypothetical protein